MLCFAYGSNMSEGRLGARITGYRAIGIGYIVDKVVVCNKRSQDGSAKANLVTSDGDSVWGVLFEIPEDQVDALDRAEGGYTKKPYQVVLSEGDEKAAEAYVSQDLTDEPVPYDWYKEHIVEGAREHSLPEDYIRTLEMLPSKPDPRRSSV